MSHWWMLRKTESKNDCRRFCCIEGGIGATPEEGRGTSIVCLLSSTHNRVELQYNFQPERHREKPRQRFRNAFLVTIQQRRLMLESENRVAAEDVLSVAAVREPVMPVFRANNQIWMRPDVRTKSRLVVRV